MKALRIILQVLGILFIAVNILVDLAAKPNVTAQGTAEYIGYQIGRNSILLLGVLFLFVAQRIKKKIQAKKKQKEMNEFLKD